MYWTHVAHDQRKASLISASKVKVQVQFEAQILHSFLPDREEESYKLWLCLSVSTI